jgi:DNA-binding SARP family transcriptional activator
LRPELAPQGVLLERQGDGYRLDLAGATLDAQVFAGLVAAASEAAAAGENERAAAQAEEAVCLWRGAVASGVALYQDARADADHLEELRLRALEVRVDAELALGRHAEIVGELRRLVESNPHHERFAAQLMLALYRSGRQAEALAAYERTRRALIDDLGIRPGPELQRLSGQIVRHEPELAVAVPVATPPAQPVPARRRGLVAALAVLAGLLAVAVGLAWGRGGGASDATAAGTRVALVVPRGSTAGREDVVVTPFVDGLYRAGRRYGFEPTTLDPDELRRRGAFDLVLAAALDPGASAELANAGAYRNTPFVLIDAALAGAGLQGAPNATGLSFADEKAGYLAGYLSGLMAERRSSVSVVGGKPTRPVRALVRGLSRGARAARPGIAVQVAYANSFIDQAACERIANRQIDRGSTVVFAAAGTCGLGALSAAGLRGVWGVGSDADRSYLGSHILVSTVKRTDLAVELAIQWFLQGSLPSGDVVLGLDDDAVGIAGISPDVPAKLRRKVATVAASLRAAEARPSP